MFFRSMYNYLYDPSFFTSSSLPLYLHLDHFPSHEVIYSRQLNKLERTIDSGLTKTNFHTAATQTAGPQRPMAPKVKKGKIALLVGKTFPTMSQWSSTSEYILRNKAHVDISWLLMAIANSVRRENPTDEVRQ